MKVHEMRVGQRFRVLGCPWLTGKVLHKGEGSVRVRLWRDDRELYREFDTAAGKHVRIKKQSVTEIACGTEVERYQTRLTQQEEIMADETKVTPVPKPSQKPAKDRGVGKAKAAAEAKAATAKKPARKKAPVKRAARKPAVKTAAAKKPAAKAKPKTNGMPKVEALLKKYDGNVTAVAKELDVNPRTLFGRLRRAGVDWAQYRKQA